MPQLRNTAGVTEVKGEDGLASVLLSIDGDADIRADVFDLVKKSGWTLYEKVMERNSLEDVFRTLTTVGESA